MHWSTFSLSRSEFNYCKGVNNNRVAYKAIASFQSKHDIQPPKSVVRGGLDLNPNHLARKISAPLALITLTTL